MAVSWRCAAAEQGVAGSSRLPLFAAGRIGNNGPMQTTSRPSPSAALRGAAAVLACVLPVLLLAACASKRPDGNKLNAALYDYASAIRWGELDAALSHVDPEYRTKHPLDSIERARFAQLQVSGYYVRQNREDASGRILQTVEIRLVNRHTQTERTVVDHQVWRWDEEARRWWLTCRR